MRRLRDHRGDQYSNQRQLSFGTTAVNTWLSPPPIPVGRAPRAPITSLGEAVANNDIAKVKSFLEEGEDPNTLHQNKTLLYWSIQKDNLEIAELLVEAGANTCGKYSESSPLYQAIILKRIPIIKLIVENGAEFLLHDAVITAITKLNVKVLTELVNLGADINAPNSESEFPILCAVRLMKYPMVKFLVEKGADLTKKTSNNETALSISLENDDFRTFKLLIEAGADPALATETINNKIKTNASIATYLAKMQKTNSTNPQFDGHEAAKYLF